MSVTPEVSPPLWYSGFKETQCFFPVYCQLLLPSRLEFRTVSGAQYIIWFTSSSSEGFMFHAHSSCLHLEVSIFIIPRYSALRSRTLMYFSLLIIDIYAKRRHNAASTLAWAPRPHALNKWSSWRLKVTAPCSCVCSPAPALSFPPRLCLSLPRPSQPSPSGSHQTGELGQGLDGGTQSSGVASQFPVLDRDASRPGGSRWIYEYLYFIHILAREWDGIAIYLKVL